MTILNSNNNSLVELAEALRNIHNIEQELKSAEAYLAKINNPASRAQLDQIIFEEKKTLVLQIDRLLSDFSFADEQKRYLIQLKERNK